MASECPHRDTYLAFVMIYRPLNVPIEIAWTVGIYTAWCIYLYIVSRLPLFTGYIIHMYSVAIEQRAHGGVPPLIVPSFSVVEVMVINCMWLLTVCSYDLYVVINFIVVIGCMWWFAAQLHLHVLWLLISCISVINSTDILWLVMWLTLPSPSCHPFVTCPQSICS